MTEQIHTDGPLKIHLSLTPDEARYIEKLLDDSDGELAPAILRALAYADCSPTERTEDA